jgi:hypothetical protein
MTHMDEVPFDSMWEIINKHKISRSLLVIFRGSLSHFVAMFRNFINVFCSQFVISLRRKQQSTVDSLERDVVSAKSFTFAQSITDTHKSTSLTLLSAKSQMANNWPNRPFKNIKFVRLVFLPRIFLNTVKLNSFAVTVPPFEHSFSTAVLNITFIRSSSVGSIHVSFHLIERILNCKICLFCRKFLHKLLHSETRVEVVLSLHSTIWRKPAMLADADQAEQMKR